MAAAAAGVLAVRGARWPVAASCSRHSAIEGRTVTNKSHWARISPEHRGAVRRHPRPGPDATPYCPGPWCYRNVPGRERSCHPVKPRQPPRMKRSGIINGEGMERVLRGRGNRNDKQESGCKQIAHGFFPRTIPKHISGAAPNAIGSWVHASRTEGRKATQSLLWRVCKHLYPRVKKTLYRLKNRM